MTKSKTIEHKDEDEMYDYYLSEDDINLLRKRSKESLITVIDNQKRRLEEE